MKDVKLLTVVVRDRPLPNHDALATVGGASMTGLQLIQGAFTVSEGFAFDRKSGERRGRFQADRIEDSIRFFREAGGGQRDYCYKMWTESVEWSADLQKIKDSGLSIHGKRLFRYVNGSPVGVNETVPGEGRKRMAFHLKKLEDLGYVRRVDDASALLTRKGMEAANETAALVNRGELEVAIEDTGVEAALVLFTMFIERLTAEKQTLLDSGEITEDMHAKMVDEIQSAGDAVYEYGQSETAQ